ncbi:MAG TPA: NAD-dependent epimerase/dehydratase family protein [Bacteroidota bacterium]|nr:NAD-dependent epimerase/dehydratase family protein [Bacteroidota bacterium]
MAVILVLGCTGYVGRRLVPRLREAGHTVRCLVRDRTGVSSADNCQCEIFDISF